MHAWSIIENDTIIIIDATTIILYYHGNPFCILLYTLWSVVTFDDCDSSMNDVVAMNNLHLSESQNDTSTSTPFRSSSQSKNDTVTSMDKVFSVDEYTVRNVKANLQSAWSKTQWSISSQAYVNNATWDNVLDKFKTYTIMATINRRPPTAREQTV